MATYLLVGISEFFDWREVEFCSGTSLNFIRPCSLCGVVTPTGRILPCAHALCPPCYEDVQVKDRHCPFDDEGFEEDSVETYRINEVEISTCEVRCWNSDHGCEYQGPLSSLSQHVRTQCRFHRVACPRCRKIVLRAAMLEHWKDACSSASSTSEDSLLTTGSGSSGRSSEAAEEDCGGCIRKTSQQTVLKVERDRSETEEPVVRAELPTHAEMAAAIATLREEIGSVKTKQAQFDATSEIVLESRNKLQSLEKRMEAIEKLNPVHKILDFPGVRVREVMCGRAEWDLVGFKACVSEAVALFGAHRQSAPFVMSGYVLRLSVTIIKNTRRGHMFGVSMSICRGPNDAQLVWPYGLPSVLMLTHPQNRDLDVRHYVDPSRCPRECFTKPSQVQNTPCGSTMMCSVRDIETKGFLVGDTVQVALEVEHSSRVTGPSP